MRKASDIDLWPPHAPTYMLMPACACAQCTASPTTTLWQHLSPQGAGRERGSPGLSSTSQPLTSEAQVASCIQTAFSDPRALLLFIINFNTDDYFASLSPSVIISVFYHYLKAFTMKINSCSFCAFVFVFPIQQTRFNRTRLPCKTRNYIFK